MIISDLYQIRIECVNEDGYPYYDVDIDSTDVTVIVSVIDFNDEAVTGKNVTLTVDKGKFTSMTSTSSNYDSTGNVKDKKVVATTNNEGKFAVKYTASEFGFVSFQTNIGCAIEHIKVGGCRKFKSGFYEFEDRYAFLLNQTIHFSSDVWSNLVTTTLVKPSFNASAIPYSSRVGTSFGLFIVNDNNRVKVMVKMIKGSRTSPSYCWVEWCKL